MSELTTETSSLNETSARQLVPVKVTYSSSTDYGRQAVQDLLIQLITETLAAQFKIGAAKDQLYQTMQTVELRIEEIRRGDMTNCRFEGVEKLSFFTSLPLRRAFEIMDGKYKITERRFLAPSVHEVRQTCNLAQVLASAQRLKLLTIDGDETLYPDGTDFQDMEMAELLCSLMRSGIKVALVTAAGYGLEPKMYEKRLDKFLEYVRTNDPKGEYASNFFVFGGESNYLFRLDATSKHLVAIPSDEWEVYSPLKQETENEIAGVKLLLDTAQAALEKLVMDLSLRSQVIRKERGVGLVPGGLAGLERQPAGSGSKTIRNEILEEAVCRVREAVEFVGTEIPFCAFNGGSDVWVDVGNKAIALTVLQSMFGLSPAESIHIGDQFSESGNDISVRSKSPCIWVINPKETKAILRKFQREAQLRPR